VQTVNIDLSGKRVLVAGVADDVGFGFAIAKEFAESGAKVSIATWPPALGILETLLRRGKLDDSRKLANGSLLEFERVYPLDASYDTLDDVPAELRDSKRYAGRGDFSIQGLADRMIQDFGERPVDIVIHSLANGPEVSKPLLDTSRAGYVAALGASAYSFVSMVRRFAPLTGPGGSFLSLTYVASERVIPRYGGGMSSAKAALESDTRYLAFEAGRRYGVRVNTLSAGPYASRAASVTGAIGAIVDYYAAESPIPERLAARDVAYAAVFLSSSFASAITGTTLYVDNGFHAMGKALGPGDLEWVLGHENARKSPPQT
jgi:enoyl-[acyl-carrier protein] reductase I